MNVSKPNVPVRDTSANYDNATEIPVAYIQCFDDGCSVLMTNAPVFVRRIFDDECNSV